MSSPDEPTNEHDTEDLPQVLALRLQSSILADEEVQGLHIPLQVLYGLEETPPASRTEHDASFVDESGKILQSVSSRAVGDNITGNTNQRWEFMGSSKTNHRLVLQPSTKELKDIGIKARNRLEEEKTKRPEIQILDQMPTSDPEKRVSRKATTAFSAKVASQKPAASTDTSSSRKRKLDTSSRLKSTPPRIAKKGGRNSSQPSSWAPDVSHIELPDKDDRSATVKLHGLPINCTTELVKKFFAGLQLQHISILLPNNTSMAQLDVANPLPSRRSRCEHCRLRVLAQFQSASAAILASERSGETIRMQHHDNADEEEYVVAVTVLPTQLAKALTFVAVPAVPRTPFESTLTYVATQQLPPMVDKVLWSVVIRRMLHDSLPMDRAIHKAEIVLPQEEEDALWDQSGTRTWRSHPGYQRFAKHYNRLVDIQDDLLHQIPYPIVETNPLPPSAAGDKDPAVRLTTEACKALTNELDIIEGLLYRVRISHHLGSQK